MADFRLALHNELTALENCEAHYQPPEDVRFIYPCFIYKRVPGQASRANNRIYRYKRCWEILFITRDSESTIREDMLNHFIMCRHVRDYVSDNLYHHVFNLYY